MKVHLTGSVWHGNLSGYLADAFRSLGHEVLFFGHQLDKREDLFKKVLMRFSRHPYNVDDIFRYRISRRWLADIKSFNPDLIILEDAFNILPEFVSRARALKKPILYWVTTPPAIQQAKDMPYSLTFADRVFSIDRAWIPFLVNFAAEGRVHYLPLAGAKDVFYPLCGAEEREKISEYDICFVGGFSPQDPSGLVRAYFIDKIPEQYKLAVYGPGTDYWSKFFPRLTRAVRGKGILSGEALNKIYNASKIVLNIHAVNHLTALSARTYEIGLSGAFQLVDHREDLDVLFPPNTFSAFRSWHEMLELIHDWISNPSKRYREAERARSLILEKHTWQHRVKEMLQFYG